MDSFLGVTSYVKIITTGKYATASVSGLPVGPNEIDSLNNTPGCNGHGSH